MSDLVKRLRETVFEANWKEVPGTDGNYLASDMGHIFSMPRRYTSGGFMSQHVVCGYARAQIMYDKKKVLTLVHRVIIATFSGEDRPDMEVCHLNGDSLDNRMSNLVYGTKKENESHKLFHGTKIRGSSAYNAKMTEDSVREMRARYRDGESPTSLYEAFGISKGCGQNILYMRSWKHV